MTQQDDVAALVAQVAELVSEVDRLGSLDQIRQLPAKYALSVDMRNFDALVNLFVDDVGVPGKQRGRHALKRWYDETLRYGNLGTAHGIHGHVIDFESPDLASGIVYSRNDLETPTEWLIEMMIYLDRYERRDGVWYFQRRSPLFWYECDITNPPMGPGKLRWPGHDRSDGAYHDAFPSWRAFWDAGYDDGPIPPPAPLYRFLESFRQGAGLPKVDPHGGTGTSTAAPGS